MFRLPLHLTVRGVSRDVRTVHVDALVVDDNNVSIRFMPIDMNPLATPAEVVAILQATITNMAAALHKRGEAERDQSEATEQDFDELVGQVFVGSVAS